MTQPTTIDWERPKESYHAHFDCFSGAAGDMMLASCLDAAAGSGGTRDDNDEAHQDRLQRQVTYCLEQGLPELKGEFSIERRRVWRGGMASIAATHVTVHSQYGHTPAPVPVEVEEDGKDRHNSSKSKTTTTKHHHHHHTNKKKSASDHSHSHEHVPHENSHHRHHHHHKHDDADESGHKHHHKPRHSHHDLEETSRTHNNHDGELEVAASTATHSHEHDHDGSLTSTLSHAHDHVTVGSTTLQQREVQDSHADEPSTVTPSGEKTDSIIEASTNHSVIESETSNDNDSPHHDHTHDHEHSSTSSSSNGQLLRNYSQIRQMLLDAPPEYIPPWVQEMALEVFTELASAEAKSHGAESLDAVHFHEVGAVDSIVDTVGTLLALYYLGVTTVSCSRLPMGEGMVRTDHGWLPVPAPATLFLSRDMPTCPGPPGWTGELVTPTGVALLRVLTRTTKTTTPTVTAPIGRAPAFTIRHIGIGARTKDFEEHPNILRLILGNNLLPMKKKK